MVSLEWRGRRDSERLPGLNPRKLFIPRNAKPDENATNAEPGYTAGTRARSILREVVVRRPLFLLIFILIPTQARAQNHPAAVSGNCTASNSCSYSDVGGLVLTGANQVIVLLISGPSGGSTISSITDTYFGTGNCSGTDPNLHGFYRRARGPQ